MSIFDLVLQSGCMIQGEERSLDGFVDIVRRQLDSLEEVGDPLNTESGG